MVPAPPNPLFADVTPVTCILVHVSMFVALLNHCWLTWTCVLQPWRRSMTLWWRCVTWWPVCPGPCLSWCATFSHSSTSEWSNVEVVVEGGWERWRDKVGAGGGVSKGRCKEEVGENRDREEWGGYCSREKWDSWKNQHKRELGSEEAWDKRRELGNERRDIRRELWRKEWRELGGEWEKMRIRLGRV